MIASTACWGMGLNIGGFWLVCQSDINLQTWMIHSTPKFGASTLCRNTRIQPISTTLCWTNGLMWKASFGKVEDGIVMHGKEQVLTNRNLHGVLKACHDNPVFGGHFGRDKTYKKISQRYYWKGMLTFSVLLISMLLIIGAGWVGALQRCVYWEGRLYGYTHQWPGTGIRELHGGSSTGAHVDGTPDVVSLPSPDKWTTRKGQSYPERSASKPNQQWVQQLGYTHSRYTSGRKSELLAPRRIYKTKEDFRAISYALTGSEDLHGHIRQKIMNLMSNYIKEKLKDYLNQSVNDYLRESYMNSNGTWATDAEMMVTANLLGIDIVVHSKVADRMGWLRYPRLLHQ